MKKYLIFFGIVAAAAILMFLPYALRQSNAPSSPASSSDAEIKEPAAVQPAAVKADISGFKFAPAKITVKKGTTVEWTNQDSAAHTITADIAGTGPDSELFGKNETYRYTFNDIGVFNYHCKPHPSMKGTVEVTE